MFSVIIPLYNKEQSISNTIQSVLDQTFQDFEIIIVNDGSTDNSVKEVEKIDDKRIRLIHQENQGVSAARNKGIKEARYEWIAFLDADDLWKDNHLKTLQAMIQKYKKEMFFCTSYITNKDSKIITQNDDIIVFEDYFFALLTHKRLIWTSVVCVNKSVFYEISFFDERFSRGEDHQLWRKIGRNYKLIKSNKITAKYVIGEDNNLTSQRFDYNKSALRDITNEVEQFNNKNEEKYYLNLMLNSTFNQLKRLEFRNSFMSFIRYIILKNK